MMQTNKGLTTNALKFIACFCMLVDHIGYVFFPTSLYILRVIGRISMPIFAFFVAEGCKYTKDKTKHFLLMFGLGVFCQIVYFFVLHSLYMSILITFSLSILMIYALQHFKKAIFEGKKLFHQCMAGGIFLFSVVAVYLFNQFFKVDYGFIGCMLPVAVSLFDFKDLKVGKHLKTLDHNFVRVLCLTAGLIVFCIRAKMPVRFLNIPISWYSLLAPVFLLFYNGKKGKLKTKYFFYFFYPIHLAVLQGIAWLL